MTPYLLQYYNIYNLYKTSSSGLCRAAARILNSLIDQLNKENRLPRFLVVIIDKDLVSDLNVFDGYAAQMVSDYTNWLVKQINTTVTRKKSELLDKCPGTVFSGDPKIIFVRMLHRYERYTPGCRLKLLHGLRSKFNESLNSAAAKIGQRMLTITSCNTRDHFDYWGNLTVKGCLDFWQELNELLDRFDCGQIKLHPALSPPAQQNKNRR